MILAGGSATRLKELTRITNKHLLPVGDEPMIYSPLRALAQAGIKEVCLITGTEHAGMFIDLLGDGHVVDREGNLIFDLDLTYRIQRIPGGISQAINCGKSFANGEKFVAFLGDNIIEGNICKAVEDFEKQEDGARIFLKEVDYPQAYGVPVFDGTGKITAIEEKPKEPKSQYAVTGIYMYDQHVFEYIDTIKPSARGEMEVTDLNNEYIKRDKLKYSFLEGWWRDAGQSAKELAEIGLLIAQTGKNKMKF